MISTKLRLGLGAFAVLAAVSLLPTPSASADPGASSDRSTTPLAKANPQISTELLNSLPSSILSNPNIWIDPSIAPGTSFVIADSSGRLSVAAGQSAAQVQDATENLKAASVGTLAACRTTVVVPFLVTDLVVKSACSAVIGSSDTAKVTYTITSGDTQGDVSWQPEGHKKTRVCVTNPPLLPVCHYEWKNYWAVGQTGPGHATVTWGQVAAYARGRFSYVKTSGWNGYMVP